MKETTQSIVFQIVIILTAIILHIIEYPEQRYVMYLLFQFQRKTYYLPFFSHTTNLQQTPWNTFSILNEN